MIHQTIASKLHKAIELTKPDTKVGDWLREASSVPLFVINKELMSLFNDKHAVERSVEAMYAAGVAELPYPAMCLELWGGNDWRYFIYLFANPKQGSFTAGLVEYLESSNLRSDHGPEVVDSLMSIKVEMQEKREEFWKIEWSDRRDLNRTDAAYQVIAAVNIALTMGHLSELERTVIEAPAKLNKSRVASGKPRINDHVVVRIGHVYDREGRKITINDGNRRTMPIHMRAGHSKRQPHGPSFLDSEEGKQYRDRPTTTDSMHIVWIKPVLVNFKDGSLLPLPKPKVVKL